MSIELSRRVKALELQMAEFSRLLAELRPNQVQPRDESICETVALETPSEPVKRKRGRPRKNV